jgi:hypothetical protein
LRINPVVIHKPLHRYVADIHNAELRMNSFCTGQTGHHLCRPDTTPSS